MICIHLAAQIFAERRHALVCMPQRTIYTTLARARTVQINKLYPLSLSHTPLCLFVCLFAQRAGREMAEQRQTQSEKYDILILFFSLLLPLCVDTKQTMMMNQNEEQAISMYECWTAKKTKHQKFVSKSSINACVWIGKKDVSNHSLSHSHTSTRLATTGNSKPKWMSNKRWINEIMAALVKIFVAENLTSEKYAQNAHLHTHRPCSQYADRINTRKRRKSAMNSVVRQPQPSE